MVKVTIENGFCISVKILVPSHQGVKRLNFVKKNEKIWVFGNFELLKYIEYPKTTIWNKVERITD